MRHSRSKAFKFANFETLKKISDDYLLADNKFDLFLRCFVILLLVISLTGTSVFYNGKSNEFDYVFVLDSSASMLSTDIAPNRFDSAKFLLNNFVNAIDSQASFGLVTFAGSSFISKTLVTSKEEIRLALRDAKIRSSDGSDISGAIISAVNLLVANQDRGGQIIMVSDGLSTGQAYVDAPLREAVTYAIQNRVIVHSIGIGTSNGTAAYVPSELNLPSGFDSNALEYSSNQTGGLYLYASQVDDFNEVFSAITSSSVDKVLEFNISFLSLAFAFVVLLFEWVLANTAYKRLI